MRIEGDDGTERISTHTPHTGCDFDFGCDVWNVHISTHTPHTGCDSSAAETTTAFPDFNSHTPHGVRHEIHVFENNKLIISTHTPHTGCDLIPIGHRNINRISTHTPHTGCDNTTIGAA